MTSEEFYINILFYYKLKIYYCGDIIYKTCTLNIYHHQHLKNNEPNL